MQSVRADSIIWSKVNALDKMLATSMAPQFIMGLNGKGRLLVVSSLMIELKASVLSVRLSRLPRLAAW